MNRGINHIHLPVYRPGTGPESAYLQTKYLLPHVDLIILIPL